MKTKVTLAHWSLCHGEARTGQAVEKIVHIRHYDGRDAVLHRRGEYLNQQSNEAAKALGLKGWLVQALANNGQWVSAIYHNSRRFGTTLMPL